MPTPATPYRRSLHTAASARPVQLHWYKSQPQIDSVSTGFAERQLSSPLAFDANDHRPRRRRAITALRLALLLLLGVSLWTAAQAKAQPRIAMLMVPPSAAIGRDISLTFQGGPHMVNASNGLADKRISVAANDSWSLSPRFLGQVRSPVQSDKEIGEFVGSDVKKSFCPRDQELGSSPGYGKSLHPGFDGAVVEIAHVGS